MFLLNTLKRAFTTIRIDPDSGILLQDSSAPAWYVRRIRLWNLIEPFVVYGLILLIVWTSMLDEKVWWVRPSLGALILWMLVISPLVHYPFEKRLFLTPAQQRLGLAFYFFECRGLGSPIRYSLPINGEPPFIKKYWKEILCALGFLDLLFICAMITFNSEILERYKEHMATPMHAMFFRAYMLGGIDLGLLFLVFPFMLRLDNLRESIGLMGALMIVLVITALVANLLFQRNESALREFFKDNPYMSLCGAPASVRLKNLGLFAIGGQWSGYVFWGFLQQLMFLGIFSVQFCRAFDVGRSRGQLFLACLCSASLFGLIHIPNFWLSVITWFGGFVGAFYAVQCRNLFALGIVHGLGGTLFNKLLPINFSVGPSQVK